MDLLSFWILFYLRNIVISQIYFANDTIPLSIEIYEKKEEFIIHCLFAFPNGIYRHFVVLKNETLLRRWDFARISFHKIENKLSSLLSYERIVRVRYNQSCCYNMLDKQFSWSCGGGKWVSVCCLRCVFSHDYIFLYI